MNRRMVVYVLCVMLRVEAAVLVPALLIGFVEHETAASQAILWTIIALLACSCVTQFFKPRDRTISPRSGFFICAMTWVVASFFGCLPFVWSGYIPHFMDAFFETVSGFTTTGATILSDVEALPYSLLYWRSFTHWVGGMGVLVLVMAIIPLASKKGAGTINLLRAESPGPVVDKLVPRISDSSKILYGIYIVLTVMQILLLLAGGMSAFEAVTTAFGTAGTGGFGVLNTSLASYSPYLQNVTTVFMALFGINFNVFYLLIMRDFSKLLRNSELWTYLGLMFASIFVIASNTLPFFHGDYGESFQQASFQVASIMTTTGFATVDFNLWPELSRMILVMLMFVGASAGSTGGGLKTARVVILAKSLMRDMKRLARPRSVSVVRVSGQRVDEDVIRATQGYLAAYLFIIMISMLVVAVDNFSFETTFTSVVSCMNNIGPGLDLVGPTGNYGMFSDLAKGVLTADMLIGRLELYPMLLLFMPSAYRA